MDAVGHGPSGGRARPRVLIVDLNNFARYPTLSVGYMVRVLRDASLDVSVFSPFTHGWHGVVREPPARPWSLADQWLRHASATSNNAVVRRVRALASAERQPIRSRDVGRLVGKLREALDDVDVVVISTYLMYREACQQISAACLAAGIPVLIGGPYFAQRETSETWQSMQGVTALIAGEAEPYLVELVEAAYKSERLTDFDGVFDEAGDFQAAPPLGSLSDLPFPDFDDFPWQNYPSRIIPIIAGRGCGWGVCQFCSDITSTSGRTFRSRSGEHVLSEVQHQAIRYGARLFVFTDLKLNSNLRTWRSIIAGIQTAAPGAEWVCAVHVGTEDDNGLDDGTLERAAAAGLRRVTTGLESGSQRILDSMSKGTKVGRSAAFVRSADAAGISVRVTMILGYPGETADDVLASAELLESLRPNLDRVALNRFQLMTGTRLHRAVERNPWRYPDLEIVEADHGMAQLTHSFAPNSNRAYRAAVRRLLVAVHRINRKPLKPASRVFDGVM